MLCVCSWVCPSPHKYHWGHYVLCC
jgi:hypothetical protein